MSLVQSANFLRAVLPVKPLIDTYRQVCLLDGYGYTTDGSIFCIAPMDELGDLEFTCNGDKFLRAIISSEGAAEVTHKERIVIKDGKLRVQLNAGIVETFPTKCPPNENEMIELGYAWRDVLALLQPFVGTAGRNLWSTGLLLRGTHAYATDNITLLRADLPFEVPHDIIIPLTTVEYMLQHESSPIKILVEEHVAWFQYPEDCWIWTNLVSAQWPNVDDMLVDVEHELPPTLSADVKKLMPYCNDSLQTIILNGDSIRTAEGDVDAEISGYALGDAKFRARPLLKVLSIATHADFSSSRVPFKGEGFIGIMVGLK